MPTQKRQSNPINQFSGLPMKALIGAPLKAATDANAMIARAQAQFLISTCFKENPNDDSSLSPVMVNFTLERQTINANGEITDHPAIMKFSIPLMSLIPINSLAIETLKISFDMEVKSSREFSRETSSDRKKRQDSSRIGNAYHAHEFDTELHGTLSSSNKSSGNTQTGANYEITLTAGQLPLPKGVTAILDIFSKNLAPIPLKDNS
jgi:hypothetical protein